MQNRRRSNLSPNRFQLPTPMSDVVFCLLLTFLVSQPLFLDSLHLPTLRPSDDGPVQTSSGNTIRVVLSRVGRLTCEDQPLELDDLPHRLSKPALSSRTIDLLIDLNANGQGATEKLLRLQIALEQAGLLSRVRLRFNNERSSVSQPSSPDSAASPNATNVARRSAS